MIEAESVWKLLLDELRDQEAAQVRPAAVTPGASKWAREGKIAAYLRVLALDPGDPILFGEPDKVLMEARTRLSLERRG